MMPAFQRRVAVISSMREIFAAAGFALALLMPLQAEAQVSYEPSLVSRLPEYCKYTQLFRDNVPGGNNPAEIERLTRLMGNTFIHMHHYCFGLMNVNRAAFLSNTRGDRLHNLNYSLLEFDYVIDRAPADFSLLPEILTRRGESLILLDRSAEAMLEFQRAIKIKADYTLPYAAMSDYYKGTGQLPKAREWLEKGLAAAPNARPLMRRMAELDRLKGKRETGSARKPAAPPPQ